MDRRARRHGGGVEPVNRVRRIAERHPLRVAAGVGVACAVGMIVRLLLPTPVGLADQGDGHRLLCQLGLRADIPWDASPNAFVRFTWLNYQFVGETCGANGTGQPYFSSELLLLRIASWLTGAFGLPGGLDLRVLGVVCAVIAGIAVGWLVAELRGPVLGRAAVGLATAAVLADPGFADYFVSAYSEPASFLGVLLLCPALVRLFRERQPTWPTLLVTAVVAAFVLTSKTQMISLLPGLLLALLLRPGPGADLVVEGDSRSTRLRAAARRRAVAVLLATGLVWLSVAYLAAQPKRFSEANMYSQVFLTILPNSPDPTDDLRWFGLDPQLASGSGKPISAVGSAAMLPAYTGFTEQVTFGKVAMFYLSHPGRLPHLGFAGLAGAADFRPPATYLANRPAGPGQQPNAAEHRLETATGLFALYAAAPGLLALHWLVATIVFAVAAYRRSPIGRTGCVVMAALFCQFWAVLLSEGMADLIKHMVVVDLLTALTVPLGIALWIGRRRPMPGHTTSQLAVRTG
jgi:hypothetical protein